MTKKELNNSIKELMQEIKNNCVNVDLYKEIKQKIENVKFEKNAMLTICLSLFPYLAMLIALGMTVPGIIQLISNMPAIGLSSIVLGGSLGIGFITRKIIDYKFKVKERHEEFLSKTEQEKMQEEVECEIELEKIKNRNLALKKVINKILSDQEKIESLSENYEISNKTINQSSEECEKTIENIESLLKKKFEELDTLSIQSVLHEKSWYARVKDQKFNDILGYGLLAALITMLYSCGPIILVKNIITYSSSQVLIVLLLPMAIGALGEGAYIAKKYDDTKKTFDIINKELGENSLPDTISGKTEENELKSKINAKTLEICNAKIKLLESKRVLESLDEENSSKDINKSIQTNVHEKEIENNDQIRFGTFDSNHGSEEKSEKEEKGKVFVYTSDK